MVVEVLGNWAKSPHFQSEGCWNNSGMQSCSTATFNFPADTREERQTKLLSSVDCTGLGRVENVLEVTLLRFPVRSWQMGYMD